MQTSKSHQGKQLLAAAVASVGLASFGAAQAGADLALNLRALSATGVGNSISPDGKTVLVPVADGRTITMALYARVTGTNTVQAVHDVNGDGSLLVTTNDDSLDILVGAFKSTGPFKGNMGGSVAGPNNVYNPLFPPFGSLGSNNGVFQDFDSDGDLDLGATGTDPINMWTAYGSLGTTGAVASDGTHGYYWSGAYFPQSQDTVIDATSNEMRIGTIRFIATGGSGMSDISFVPRQNGDLAALWLEDGIATGKNLANALFSAGTPVSIGIAVPEPTTTSLLGIISMGLLARRRARS